jgi:hypothetical protein
MTEPSLGDGIETVGPCEICGRKWQRGVRSGTKPKRCKAISCKKEAERRNRKAYRSRVAASGAPSLKVVSDGSVAPILIENAVAGVDRIIGSVARRRAIEDVDDWRDEFDRLATAVARLCRAIEDS